MEYKLTVVCHALECVRVRFVMASIGVKFEFLAKSKANEDLCIVPTTIRGVVSTGLELMRIVSGRRPRPAQVET
jgi:hypothetical protein